jgi:DegV family protein with EDD domain
MIAVVTDTCACIPPPLAHDLRVEAVPYFLHRGAETLRDQVDITPAEFYAWLPSAAPLPTTANPGPGDYLAAFERVAAWADGVVVVTMTAKGSGAYQSAGVARELAATQLPGLGVDVVDTEQVAMAHGWAAVEAARSAMQGAALAEVVATARSVAARGCMLKTADTLRYLYMGGRIGRARHLVGTLLNIKPIIGMEAGVIVARGTARSIARACERIVDMMADFGAADHPIKVAVTHAAAPERAERLLAAVTARYDCRETLISELSPALGVHTGPGCVGVNFFSLVS